HVLKCLYTDGIMPRSKRSRTDDRGDAASPCTWRHDEHDRRGPLFLSRIAKIFKRAFPLGLTPLPLPTLRLVFCSTLTHTQQQCRRQRLRGRRWTGNTYSRISRGPWIRNSCCAMSTW